MPSKEASNNRGLCPVKGHHLGLCSWTRARNQFSSLSLNTDETPPHCHMPVVYPSCYLSSYILLRDPPRPVRVQKTDDSTPSWELVGISFPCNPKCPGTQNSPIVCRVEMSLIAHWHCCTNGDVVLAAWRAFRAARLSEQIITYFSGLTSIWMS
jgi:hypothetical protein